MNNFSTHLFQTIFDQTPVSTQVFTPDGETVLVNKAWEELWQISFDQVKHYNILKDKQLVETGTMAYVKRAFKGESVFLPTIKYEPSKTISIKGAIEFRWLSARMYPIKDASGKITYLVLHHEDITGRKESERDAFLMAAIVEHSDDAILSKDLDGTVMTWNKGAEKLYGYSAKEIIGKPIFLVIPQELQAEERAMLSRLKSGKKIEHYRTFRKNKNGSVFAVSISISPIRDARGTIIGASKISRNVTKEVEAENAVKESEKRLRIALDAGKIGVWEWDLRTDEIAWTDNVYTIHGVDRGKFKLTLASYKSLIHPDDRDQIWYEIHHSIIESMKMNKEFRILTPNGETRWVSTSAIVSETENGKPVKILGATSDITQQKQIEQDKSDFLSMASHELKTPLTSMKMFVDLLCQELQEQQLDRPLYLTNRIKDQTTRLSELTNDLLDVSRIETGKLQLKMESFSLTDLLTDTVEGIQSTTKHRLKVITKFKSKIVADRYRIYQVIVNLLTNAIKYSPVQEQIKIEVQKVKNSVVVSVKDRGIGIAKGKHVKIFNRLYQVTDPVEKTYPGLGLGLYISKEIVERHGGKIWVESKKGAGSTFYFSLPLTQETELAPNA